MSLTNEQEQLLLRLAGRVEDLESEVKELSGIVPLCAKEDSNTAFNSIELESSTTPVLEVIQGTIEGTDNQAIDISTQGTLGEEDHWTGIRVKPDTLDPSGADTRIRGIAVNLSGVDCTNVPESMNGIRLIMPSGLTGAARDAVDAIYIQDGDIDHNYSVPNTAYSQFTAYDFAIDSSLLAANSEIHTIDVATTGGSPSGDVVALATHTYVAPIHQHIGTYTTPSQTEYAGRKTTGGTVWADGIDTNEIFVKNADEVYIGSTAEFSEIEVVMTTDATKHIGLEFYFNTAADAWTQFYPADDTIGFQQSGLIRWEEGDLATWTNDGDPGGADSSAGYWIKIVRTSGPDPGTPTPTTMKIGTTALYYWDEDGVLSVASAYIGDTANAKMTQGLTINQAANDDEILALKSSDIAHGVTDFTETDTFGTVTKLAGTTGGLQIRGYGESEYGILFEGTVTTNNTDKTNASEAPVEVRAYLKSGTGRAAMGANANIFAVQEAASTRFLVDEDGDYFYDGADGGAFDAHDDLSLVRAFTQITSSKDVVKSEWDKFVSHKENDLVELGILGDTVENGGLVCGSQLQRLHNGAIWQLAEKFYAVEEKLKIYKQALLDADIELPQLD